MKIRLRKEAPWQEVILNDGFSVLKSKYVEDDGSHNFKPIQRWIEKEDIVIENKELNKLNSNPINQSFSSVAEEKPIVKRRKKNGTK